MSARDDHADPFAALAPPPACLSGWLVSRAALGEVSPDEAARVEAHVATCARCRERLASERAAVATAAVAPLPAALAAAQRPRLSLVPGGATSRSRAMPSRAPRRLAWVATYAAAIAALVLFATRTTPPDDLWSPHGERGKGALKVELALRHDGVVKDPAPLAAVGPLAPGDGLRLRVSRTAGLYVAVEGFDDAATAMRWVELYRGAIPDDGWLPVALEVTPGAAPRLRLAVCRDVVPPRAAFPLDALAGLRGCTFVAHTFELAP